MPSGKLLSPAAYQVLRHESTERPGSSPLDAEKRNGLYSCAGCNLDNFSSETKFHSGTGWPSFYKPLPNSVGEKTDTSAGMVRTEVHCRRCGGHLGHVFDDGPRPTGLRYCMNGVALSSTPSDTAPNSSGGYVMRSHPLRLPRHGIAFHRRKFGKQTVLSAESYAFAIYSILE